MTIRAFIFDLDGVLTDTAAYHYQAWQRMAERLGIPFTLEDNESLKGVSRRDSMEWILAKGNMSVPEEEILRLMHEKNEDYKQLIGDITEANVFPGVVPLLQTLRERGMKLGLASASKNARTIIVRLGLEDHFDYIADAARIPNSKPAPDIFLDVMQAFHLQAEECIGIEDAVAGVDAIKAANMFAVGIGEKAVLHHADLVFKEIAAFDLEEVLRKAS